MSATGKPERLSDTPVTMDIITAEDIRRSGARDLPTLLKRLPGIDSYHGSPGTQEVSMGGYIQVIGARVMVLLNGRQLYLGSFGAVFWSSLPVELDEIRQIEVIRGPESALYGFNAVDGVINIITFDPVTDPVTGATLRLGNDSRRDGSASFTQTLAEDVGLRLTAAADHAHDQGGIASPLSPLATENPDRKLLSAYLSAVLDNGDHVSFEASHSDISQRSVAAGTAQFFDARDKTDSVKFDYIAETAIGRLGASAALTLYDFPEASSGGLGEFRLHDHTAEAELYDLFKPTAFDSLRIGVQARNENMNVVNFSSGTISGRLLAGSAMWEHQFAPALSIVNALRYDYFHLGRKSANLPGDLFDDHDFDRSVQGYSSNSSLIYKLTADDSLRASAARGLALPSLLDFGQLALFMPQEGGSYFYGNPALNPSEVYEERLGWDHRFADSDIATRLSLYHEQTMRVIASQPASFPTPPPPECNPNNPLTAQSCYAQIYGAGNGAVVNGVQVQIDHKSAVGLTWGANYSFERLSLHSVANPNSEVQLQNSLPIHKVNAAIGYGWQQWNADLRLFYASGTRGTAVEINPTPQAVFLPIKDYLILSPRVAYSASDRLVLEFSADNLWTYKDNLAQRTSPTFFLTARIAY
jgi:iron complex outermembrane receptor protein